MSLDLPEAKNFKEIITHTECEVRLGPFEDPWGFECMGPSFRVIATPRKH